MSWPLNCLFAIALVFALQQAQTPLAPVAIAIVLTFVLAPLVRWLRRRGVPEVVGAAMVVLALIGSTAPMALSLAGRYLLAVGIIYIGIGMVTGLVLWALGLPNPTLWGVVAAVMSFVPYIGPLAVVGLLLLAGIGNFDSWPQMLAPAVFFAMLHAVESNVVTPWVVGRRLALSSISVFLSVMFWAWVWGIAGALIELPLLIGIRSACQRTRQAKLLCRFLEGNRRDMPTLRALLQTLPRRGLRAQPPPPGPQLRPQPHPPQQPPR